MPIDRQFSDWVKQEVSDALLQSKMGDSTLRAIAQQLLCENCNLSNTTIHDYRRGNSDYPLETLLLVLFAHGLTLSELAERFTVKRIRKALRKNVCSPNEEIAATTQSIGMNAIKKLEELKKGGVK